MLARRLLERISNRTSPWRLLPAGCFRRRCSGGGPAAAPAAAAACAAAQEPLDRLLSAGCSAVSAGVAVEVDLRADLICRLHLLEYVSNSL
jgi:hypothetical protein